MSKAQNIVTSKIVEINAPASVVWQILTDLPRYREWNPFTVRVESSLRLGDPVDLYIPIPGQEGQEMCVREWLVAYEPDQLLSWEQRTTAESKDCARRDQYVESVGPEKSRYFTTDIFLGLNQDKIMSEFGAWVKTSFDAVADSVKRRAEALYAQQYKA